MRIALVGNTKAQAERLTRHLNFPHLLVDPAADKSVLEVDVAVAIRFDASDAARIHPRLLQVGGAGLDGIAMDALAPDTWVCNAFEHEGPMAEYAMLAMLEHAIGLGAMASAFSAEAWSETYRTRKFHGEVAGSTVGILGFGHIGRAIAARAKAFGMRVMAVAATPRAPSGEADWIGTPDRLDEMLAAADFLVIACPLTEKTRGMIGAARLGRMKPTALLINVARAEIAVEEDLFRALESRAIAGAVLDTWYRYPGAASENVAPARFPFDRLPNVRCTPHASAWTEAVFDRRYAFIAQNIARLRDGRPLLNVVRPPIAADREVRAKNRQQGGST